MIHASEHLVASSVLFHWNCPLYLTPLLVREIVAVRELVTPVNRNICQQSLVELVSPTISMELESNFLPFLFGWFHYLTQAFKLRKALFNLFHLQLNGTQTSRNLLLESMLLSRPPALHLDTGSIAVASEHFKVANCHHRLHRGQRACSTNVPVLERAW